MMSKELLKKLEIGLRIMVKKLFMMLKNWEKKLIIGLKIIHKSKIYPDGVNG